MVPRGACRSLESLSRATLTIVVSRTAMFRPRVATPAITRVARSRPPDMRSTRAVFTSWSIHPWSPSRPRLSSARRRHLGVLPARYRAPHKSRPGDDDTAGPGGQHSGMPTLARTASRRAVGLTALVLPGVTAIAGCGQERTPAAATPKSGPVSAMQTPFATVQQQFERVVQVVSPQVVQIQSTRGLGSGVVFDGRGDVVTNAHVVAGARQFLVTLSGGDQHPATLVGSDPAH